MKIHIYGHKEEPKSTLYLQQLVDHLNVPVKKTYPDNSTVDLPTNPFTCRPAIKEIDILEFILTQIKKTTHEDQWKRYEPSADLFVR